MITRRTFWLTPALAFGGENDPHVMTIDLRTGGPYAFPPHGRAYRENAPSHRIWRRVLIEAPDVIAGLIKAIDGLTLANSGEQPIYFDGTVLPW